jgi:hypothetical protein
MEWWHIACDAVALPTQVLQYWCPAEFLNLEFSRQLFQNRNSQT